MRQESAPSRGRSRERGPAQAGAVEHAGAHRGVGALRVGLEQPRLRQPGARAARKGSGAGPAARMPLRHARDDAACGGHHDDVVGQEAGEVA